MKRFFCTSMLVLSLSSMHAFAGPGDGEIIEVEAPDLSGTGAPVIAPVTIGGLVAGGGYGAPGVASKPKSSSATKATTNKTAKESKQKRETKKGKEKSLFDWLLGLVSPQANVAETVAETARDTMKYSSSSGGFVKSRTVTVQRTDGTITTTTDMVECKSDTTTAGNVQVSSQPSCVDILSRSMVDPDDGQRKYEVKVVEFRALKATNPNAVGVDEYGYFRLPKEVLTFVVTDADDLLRQLLELQYL